MEIVYEEEKTIKDFEPMSPFISCKVRWVAEDLMTHNDKVIIVSQWIDNLKIYATLLKQMNITHIWLDGSVAASQRHKIVNNFQENPNIRICLLSLTASSEGINLTAACRVYHVDPWWNDSKATQASDRVHRIGQTKDVFITHLRVKNSIEVAIESMQNMKSKIVSVVSGISEATKEMTWANDIRLMLAPREQDAYRSLKKDSFNLNKIKYLLIINKR